MKKIYRYLLLTVLALCLSIPALGAEAASVALLPLINNVAGDTIASQVYFKSALSSINAQQGFVLVDNDQLTAAIESAQLGREVPDSDFDAMCALTQATGCEAPRSLSALDSLPVRFTEVIRPEDIRTAALN